MPTMIAKSLEDLRRRKGLSQTALASRLNISTAQVSRIESGKRDPSVIIMIQWIEVCEGSLSILPPDETKWPEGLTSAQAYVLRQVVQLAPRLTADMWATLGALVETWEKLIRKKT